VEWADGGVRNAIRDHRSLERVQEEVGHDRAEEAQNEGHRSQRKQRQDVPPVEVPANYRVGTRLVHLRRLRRLPPPWF